MTKQLSISISVAVAVLGRAAAAHADVYVEEPTAGTPLPTAPLAGEFDGRVVGTNPGGLALVRGAELALAIDQSAETSSSAGRNVGAYAAFAGGGGILPRFGLGLGVEWLHSAGETDPDPGNRVRFTVASGSALGKHLGWGTAWRRFRDDGKLDAVDTFDFGLTARIGSRIAVGAVVRDLTTPSVAGVDVQRRYELETVLRPRGTGDLELALGGRIGEQRTNVDGWARATLRIARGLFAHGAVETRETLRVAGADRIEGRDVRATVGLEVSFGSTGAIALATGVRDDQGSTGALGGQLVLRASAAGLPSVLGHPDHIERVELTGALDLSRTTALVRRLREIARDPSARAVVVVLDRLEAGAATRQELRDELLALRRAGKRVFAHLLSGTQAEYFVASAADKIYVDPAVDIDLVGISVTTPYFRGALDKLGVVPQFVKIDEFKDAPELFTEATPSESSTKQTNELVDSMWDQFLTSVADGRRLSKDALKKLVDGGPYTPDELAKTKQLVDGVATADELAKAVHGELGRKLPVGTPPSERPDRWRRPSVAVIYIDGEIVRGKSSTPSPIPLLGGGDDSGDETIAAAIKRARDDSQIGAIIIRVNSPGGDSVASELIAREVFATRGKKPIICSLGDYAASGGYFVAAGCDVIFAQPMTLTGSIGVFAGKLDVSALAGSLGITNATVKRGDRAGIYDVFGLPFVPVPVSFRPWTDDERAKLLESVRYAYGRFVGAVASGRGMRKDAVDAVARGRVWTGSQAKPIKLVDRHGGLNDAIDEAARRMHLDPAERVELVELPKEPGLLDTLRGKQSRAAILPRRSALQSRLPFELVW